MVCVDVKHHVYLGKRVDVRECLHLPRACQDKVVYVWRQVAFKIDLIREIKTWLNINHITVRSNTYFIF